MKRTYYILLFLMLIHFACERKTSKFEAKNTIQSTEKKLSTKQTIIDSPHLLRKEIPILCYHQVRELNPTKSILTQDLIISPKNFNAHLKMLSDSGYQSILPDQLYDYLTKGSKLPKKPFMITFDDNDLNQYNIALPLLDKYHFKAVFFIMTVTIGKAKYMSAEQIKDLSTRGHVIASHTYDHQNFNKIKTDLDWETQIEKPIAKLKQITGKRPEYFAFPYGLWNKEHISKLEKNGVKLAFILSTQQDKDYPLLTVRRMIDPNYYTAKGLYQSMQKTFNKAQNIRK